MGATGIARNVTISNLGVTPNAVGVANRSQKMPGVAIAGSGADHLVAPRCVLTSRSASAAVKIVASRTGTAAVAGTAAVVAIVATATAAGGAQAVDAVAGALPAAKEKNLPAAAAGVR